MRTPADMRKMASSIAKALLGGRNARNPDGAPVETEAAGRGPIPYLQIGSNLQLMDFRDDTGRVITLAASATPSLYESGIKVGNLWGAPNVVWLADRLLAGHGLLVDVGANIGCVSLPLAARKNQVVAIEMIPENCLKLQLSKVLNNLPDIEVVQAAASDQDAVITYGGQDAWGMVGHGDKPAVSLRLDTVWAISPLILGFDLTRPMVLKIDVEGHELQVLRGAERLIRSFRPYIIFESIQNLGDPENTVAIDCKNLVCSWGYELYLQFERTLVPRRPSDDQEGLVSDFLASPAERGPISDLLPVRQLTLEERHLLITRDAQENSAIHRQHAAVAMRRFEEENPAYCQTRDALPVGLAP